MPDDTANAAPSPEAPLHVPSVFISYAAEDRTAARTLRDTLAAAGLDVWYDEEELTGGDAWDQKIRRQIRDCDYFMPVISANTEARKEGYFRREWRLATERTLDMADDVLFLLPVALDHTPEIGARVPEKFLSVQWLRVPGGQPTPAFSALLTRLRAGEHQIQARSSSGTTRAPFAYHRTTAPFTRPPVVTAPPMLASPPKPAEDETGSRVPPPMPPFPHVPEKGSFFHGIKFLAEVMWWMITAAWSIFVRLPKWARVLLTIWLVLSISSVRCNRPEMTAPTARPAPGGAGRGGGEGNKKFRKLAERLAEAPEKSYTIDTKDLARIGAEIAHVFTEGVSDSPATGKTLLFIPFAPPTAEAPGAKFAHAVFVSLYGRFSLERRGDVGVVTPLRSEPIPSLLMARAKNLNAGFVLAASPVAEAESATLDVKLFSVAEQGVIWNASFPIKDADATTVAGEIAAKVIPLVPKREKTRGKAEPDK